MFNSEGEISSQVTEFETSGEPGNVAQSQGALESKYKDIVTCQLEGDCEVDASETVQVTQAAKTGEQGENRDEDKTENTRK